MRNPIKSRLNYTTTHHYLHCFANPFSEAISLRISSRAHIELGIQFPRERLSKFTNKARISIVNNDFRNTMKYIAIVNKETYCLFGGDFFVTWNKVSHFC